MCTAQKVQLYVSTAYQYLDISTCVTPRTSPRGARGSSISSSVLASSHSACHGSSSTPSLVALIFFIYLWLYLSIYKFKGNVHIDNYPLNTIKGKICSQTFIKEFEDRTNNIDYSVKPKSILLTFGESRAEKKLQMIHNLVCEAAWPWRPSSPAPSLPRGWAGSSPSRSTAAICWTWSHTASLPASSSWESLNL